MAVVSEQSSTLIHGAQESIRRFDVHQIIQHAGLMSSFVLLVITGLPLKFYTLGFSQWWVALWGGVEVTRSVHHFAAWAMIIVCAYHLFYLIYNLAIKKKPFPVKMVPSKSDIITLGQELQWFVGIRKERPQFDRFNWREKFDYWAIFWGIPVMGGTGFVMMYPVLVTEFLPGWVVPAAMIAHTDEAMLALCWIFFVHIFFNHFTPGNFPMNKVIFTGSLSKKRYKLDHPLEYERIISSERSQTETNETATRNI